MSKTTDDLVRIADAGGGMYVAASKTTEDLVRIAHAASNKGARLIVTEASRKTTEDLVRIAHAGNGCVLFDMVN